MMSSISKDIGRGDFVIHRGSDERLGVRWEVDNRDGRGLVGKDLRKWEATFKLLCRDKVVYSQPCLTTSNGYSIANIPGNAFEDEIWVTRKNGEWRIDGRGPDGERELLGWGHYEMV